MVGQFSVTPVLDKSIHPEIDSKKFVHRYQYFGCARNASHMAIKIKVMKIHVVIKNVID